MRKEYKKLKHTLLESPYIENVQKSNSRKKNEITLKINESLAVFHWSDVFKMKLSDADPESISDKNIINFKGNIIKLVSWEYFNTTVYNMDIKVLKYAEV